MLAPPARASTSSTWYFCVMSNCQRPPSSGSSATQRPRASAGTTQRKTRERPERADHLLRQRELDHLVERPGAEVVVVRHDARAGLELLDEARQQLQVHLRQQVHRHHADAAQVGLEQVLHLETRQRLDAGALRVRRARASPAADRCPRPGPARRSASPPRSRCARRPNRDPPAARPPSAARGTACAPPPRRARPRTASCRRPRPRTARSPSRQRRTATRKRNDSHAGKIRSHAPVAQWIEQPPPKGQVARSIRVWGASFSRSRSLLPHCREITWYFTASGTTK